MPQPQISLFLQAWRRNISNRLQFIPCRLVVWHLDVRRIFQPWPILSLYIRLPFLLVFFGMGRVRARHSAGHVREQRRRVVGVRRECITYSSLGGLKRRQRSSSCSGFSTTSCIRLFRWSATDPTISGFLRRRVDNTLPTSLCLFGSSFWRRTLLLICLHRCPP